MLTLEIWYPKTLLRDLCLRAKQLLPALGLELLCDPIDKVDMGMVASWEVVRLPGHPLYLGLTQGQMHYAVVALFIDREEPDVIAAFEKILARAYELGDPSPSEAFLVRGMDESAGPILSLAPITSRELAQIKLMVGEPKDRAFAPQIRVLGPSLVAAAGAGSLAALTRKHVTAMSQNGGSLWLDVSWSTFRSGWSAP